MAKMDDQTSRLTCGCGEKKSADPAESNPPVKDVYV